MPRVSMAGLSPNIVPQQYVYINDQYDPSIYCASVTENGNGTECVLNAPLLTLPSDKSKYYFGEVTVFAQQNGEGLSSPLFRGVVEKAGSNLRDGRVAFNCGSHYNVLRRRSTAVRESYTSTDGGTRTFAAAGLDQFMERNPYIFDSRVFTNWLPSDILGYFISRFMETWFKERIQFYIDPASNVMEPYQIQSFKWVSGDDFGTPELVADVIQKSVVGNQVFRLSNWGSLIDFIAYLMPGVQVYEIFTNEGTVVWMAPPYRNGFVQTTMGAGGLIDWRDVGANIVDMNLETNNSGTINRFVGLGAPAQCVVTLLSETNDENENLTGLIPDWDLFDTDLPDIDVGQPIPGAGTYVYDGGCYYSGHISNIPQSLRAVLKTPEIADESVACFRPGYERVGRAWRLPNWFSFCSLGRENNFFSDPSNGEGISAQVFTEQAVKGATGSWLYQWLLYEGRVKIDWKNKSFTTEDIPTTYHLIPNPDEEVGGYVPQTATEGELFEVGLKFCRIAITFTYANPDYVPYADTYLRAGGIIDPARATAVGPGQPMVFERSDLQYIQNSNLGMPIYAQYSEVVTVDRATIAARGSIIQVPKETPVYQTYDELIIAVHGKGFSSVRSQVNDRGPLTFLCTAPPVTPTVIRDDTRKLHQIAWELMQWRGKRMRSFNVKLGAFSKVVRRGMMIIINNLGYFQNDWDAIDSVQHDLVRGKTTFTTTNQPGRSLDLLTMELNEDS